MRLSIYLLALVLHHSQFAAYAYPSNYADVDSGGGNVGGGLAATSNTNSKQEQLPLVTYITTSTTSTGGSTKSPATTTLTGKSQNMQPAFVYNAAVPTYEQSVIKVNKNIKNNNNNSKNDEANAEHDGEATKRIIGSSVVTSVSVILNGNEPEFTDALGQKVPKPMPSLHVASPINLLNPDRYEFYTFDDNGELVKRLMTMEEIQSIVANGDGDGPSIIHAAPTVDSEPEKNVQDIVDSVQNVLNKEVESNKNSTIDPLHVLDTPDVSSSWSMILPAIFNNAGGDIFPQQKPQQIVMTPDSELLETSTKESPTTKKPKPGKRKPGQKRKTTTKIRITSTTTEITPQVVQEELGPMESVYTGMQQYQNLASSMQNFDGYSQMHMQPIYHKLPEILQAETTTRRVFVNNQEIIQTPSSIQPQPTTDEPLLSEDLAKKPAGVQHKHVPVPYRVKKPNEGSSTTKRPQGTKQKKKKPATTTTTTTTTPATEVTSTTVEPTTTTSAAPIEYPESTTSSTAAPPAQVSTTPKKRRRKPTRTPGYTGNKPNRKPGAKPASQQRPKPTPTPTPTPTEVSNTTDLSAAASAHQEIALNYQQHLAQHTRPHRPATSTTSTTTTSTTTTTAAPATTTTAEPELQFDVSLDVQPFANVANIALEDNKQTIVNITKTIATTSTTTTTPAPTSATSSTTATSNVSSAGYPVPQFDSNRPAIIEIIDEPTDYGQFKKEPLPSLALLQQQLKDEKLTTSTPTSQQSVAPAALMPVDEDLNTHLSFDQIMQTLKQDEPIESSNSKIEQQPQQQIKPIKYDSAESMEDLLSIANKKKQPVPAPAMPIIAAAATTLPQYGGSTLPNMLVDEDALTSKPYQDLLTTDAASVEDTTQNEESNTPVVFITARPQLFATTNKPAETTQYPAEELESEFESESTELPFFTQLLTSTEFDTKTVAATEPPMIEALANVVKFEPLFVETPDPIVTDLTTTTESAPFTTTSYSQTVTDDVNTSQTVTDDVNTSDSDEGQTTDEATTEKDTYIQGVTRLPVVTPNFADEEVTTLPPPLVLDLNQQLNLQILQPTDQISMSDFQTQAATVASTLVDSTNPQTADTFVNSNVTKDDFNFLITDMLQQITQQQSSPEDGLRLTNFAQFNSSFLLRPMSAFLQQQKSSTTTTTARPMATLSSFDPKEEVVEEEEEDAAEAQQQLYVATTTEQPTVELMDSLTTLMPSNKEDDNVSSFQQELEASTMPTFNSNDDIEATTNQVPLLSLSQVYELQQQLKDEIKASLDQSQQNIESQTKANQQEVPLLIVKAEEDEQADPQVTTTIPEEANSTKMDSDEVSSTVQPLAMAEPEAAASKVPILSLPLIYAQQQAIVDDREALFEAERDQVVDRTQEDEQIANESENSEPSSSNQESTEQNILIVPVTTLNMQTDSMESSTEQEKELIAEKDDEMALMEANNQLTAASNEAYITAQPVSQSLVAAIFADATQTEVSTDEAEQSATTNAASAAMDQSSSTSNLAQLATAQTVPEPASDVLKVEPVLLDNAASPNEQQQTESLESSSEQTDSNSNEAPLFERITSTESESTTSFEQTTEVSQYDNEETASTQQAESEASADETISTLAVADASDKEKEVEEDPYIKLGETTAETVNQKQDQKPVNSNEKQEDLKIMPTTISELAEELGQQTTEMPQVAAESDEEHINLATTVQEFIANNKEQQTQTAKVENEATTLSDYAEQMQQETTTMPEVNAASGEANEKLAMTVQQFIANYNQQPQEPEQAQEKDEEQNKPTTLSDYAQQQTIAVALSPAAGAESAEENEQLATTIQRIIANYNDQQTQEDEEDEDDQGTYQLPALLAAVELPLNLTTTSDTTTTTTSTSPATTIASSSSSTTTAKPKTSPTKRLNTLKPVSYYKQPSLSGYHQQQQQEPPKTLVYNAMTQQQRPMQRPPALSNLMASSIQATRPPVKLEASPESSQGLEASIAHLDEDVQSFARLCNELAFSYWQSITSEKISSARSLIISPFALTSMLSMVFLGARGSTSGEMNEILKLDDMVTFNPHLIFKNVTESVEKAMDSDIATAAFVREVFSDRANGKILPFFKEKTQQLYAGHVEEVNFNVVNDIIRRRTNLLIKRHTMGKVLEYLRTNSVWVNGPLATISANLFQTDCTHGSTHERDGEMFFQVHPSVRQRRLVPIPAVLYRTGFTAGYDSTLDATVVAFGRIQDTVSTIYVMPGHQSSISTSDNLERLEKQLVEQAFTENAWSNILRSLMDYPGMEVQLPRFSHRSFVNASLGLQKMGLKGLFKSEFADLRGLTGSVNHDIYLSDMIQINTFSTCGEERISDHHHVEMYPAPPLRKRNKDVNAHDDDDDDSSEAIIDFGSLVQDSALGRGFYDDLLDPKYLEVPLSLRPRQARVPDTPRLRFDKPFLYFVRHNPTGMLLFMGRFNPRLLP